LVFIREDRVPGNRRKRVSGPDPKRKGGAYRPKLANVTELPRRLSPPGHTRAMPVAESPEPPPPPKRLGLDSIQRREALTTLWLKNPRMSTATAAEMFGVAASTITKDRKLIQQEWVRHNWHDVEAIMARQMATLDLLIEAAMPNAADGDVASIRVVLDIEKRRADLLGLDAPARSESKQVVITVEQSNAWRQVNQGQHYPAGLASGPGDRGQSGQTLQLAGGRSALAQDDVLHGDLRQGDAER
jgi:hypothetical protein